VLTHFAIQMLFTWDTKNLCVVFRWWHISSTLSLIVSLVAIVALVAGYEALREGIRRYETWVNKRSETVPSKWARYFPILNAHARSRQPVIHTHTHTHTYTY
jgi:hypothetical protein